MSTKLKKLRCCCTSLYRANAVRYGAMMLMLIVGLLFAAHPAAAQVSNTACIQQEIGGNPSCTANDVRIGSYRLVSGPANCDPTSTTPITVTIEATIESGPDRYNIGLWINQKGNSARSDTTGANCYRDFLHPVGTSTTCQQQGGPYYNADSNACGDVYAQNTDPCGNKVTGPCTGGGGGTCLFTIFTFTVDILCSDSDNDGTADVSSCTSWKQSAGGVCAGALDTDPGTGSKCNCSSIDITGLHTGCSTAADCDDGIACTTDSCEIVGNNGTCSHTTNDSACDDGNECTTDTCVAASGCSNTPNTGAACGSSSDTVCDNPDTCDANGVCQPNNEPTTTVCRADAGDCDVAENCDGAGSCPADGFEPAGTQCGDTTDTVCDNPDTCNATGQCANDNNEPTTTVCRADTGDCDVAENCDGAGSCPADGFEPPGTACGSSTDTACDNPDTCNATGTCQPNNEPNGTSCADGTVCNGTEVCSNGTCNPGTPLNCDDGNVCTADSCNPTTGCVNVGSCPADTQIAPTATTCSDFANGTAADLTELFYGTKGGEINSVSPGVLFLYDGIHLDATGNIVVTQSDGTWTRLLGVHQAQVVLYSQSCTKLNVGTVSINSDGSVVTISGVPAGDYILGIKYDPTTLKGFSPPDPTAIFSFSVVAGGVGSGSDSVEVKPKP